MRRGVVKQLMENCIVSENINNDFLSQSYTQGIERITGTKDNNFQIPKEILEIRERTWDNLFDRYSKEMSDDIELNVETLEPEEEGGGEEKKVISEEEYSCGQRIPMRKPATLVQYWIDTGNPPYKALLDDNELSETGSSLSEKEITSPLVSPVINAVNTVNTGGKQKCEGNDSSCSSVDTAAYILSNANITKKADTIAIIEGAKCMEVKSLKEDIRVPTSNDMIEYMETTRINRAMTHNDDDDVEVDVEVLDTELYPMSSEIYDRPAAATSTLVSANAKQLNMYSQSLSCEETDKINESDASQRKLDDIAFIFRQFHKTSKRLIKNDKSNDVSDSDGGKAVEMDFSASEKQVSENIAAEIIAKNTSLTGFHRKKLYTGRDSPVDLILPKTHSTNRLSGARQSLHPALDSNGTTIQRESASLITHKGKNKPLLSAKRSLGSKKVKKSKERRELDCTSNKSITDISNRCTNSKQVQDSTIDSSLKSSVSDLHDNSTDRQDDIPFRREYNGNTNISVKNEKFDTQNLASLNLKPIVLLERIKPSLNRCKLKFENTHIAKEKGVHNRRHLNKSKKLYSCTIENLELETIDSDESTILICQCNVNASQRASSLNDCSLDLELNIEDDLSASNSQKNDDKLSNLKENLFSMNKNKEPQSSLKVDYTDAAMKSQVSNKNNTIWQNALSNKSKTYSHLYHGRNEMANVKLREIKVVLERLPLSVKNYSTMREMQDLNKNDTIWLEKEISNDSKMHSSNPYGTNEKDNVKLREIKVILERLPANVYLKESSDVTNTNIFPNKKISQNRRTGLQANHKREPQIKKISQTLAYENGVAVEPIRNLNNNNYSLRMNTKSKKNNQINDTLTNIVVDHRNQVFKDKIESDSTFQHKNHSKTSQDNHSKYSVLTFTSSDDDDFVGSIQHPRKKSKVSPDDNVLGERKKVVEKDLCRSQTKRFTISDRDKYRRNLSTIICSSERTSSVGQRDNESIKEKKGKHNGVDVEMKSFGNTQTATASLQSIHKNEGFVFFSSEDDNECSVADNLDKAKEKNVFFEKKNTNNRRNRKRRSNGAVKKNVIDRKNNVHVIFFQTNTLHTNSSSASEESNNYTSSTYKQVLNKRSTRNRLRHHNRTNFEESFNDSIAKRYSNKRHLCSMNSSPEMHNRAHDVKTRSKSIDKEVKTNHRLPNEESNGALGKDPSSSSFINDIQKGTLSNTLEILEETNLDNLTKIKKISDKSKNLVVNQQANVTSTVKKLLTFQTKSYYDSSDSSETM